MGLQFKIIYKQGKENLAADALSRVAHLFSLQVVSVLQPHWIQEVVNSYAIDPQVQQLLAQLAIVSPDSNGFSMEQGLIKKNNLIWIGQNSTLQTKLIAAFHSSAIGGHSGTDATYHRLKSFAWKGMKANIESFIKQCATCQHTKHAHIHLAGLLQPLPILVGV